MMNNFNEKVLGLSDERKMYIFSKYFTEITAMADVMGYPFVFLIFCVENLLQTQGPIDSESLNSCAEEFIGNVGVECLNALYQTDIENEFKNKAKTFSAKERGLSSLASGSSTPTTSSRQTTSGQTTAPSTVQVTAPSTVPVTAPPTVPATSTFKVTPSTEGRGKSYSRPTARQKGTDETDGFITSGNVDFTALSGAALDYSEISAQASGDDTTTEHAGAWALASVGSSLETVNTSVDQDTRITRRDRNNFSRVEEHLMAVKNENTILEGERKCLQCRRTPRGVTFLPCGHFTTCRECSVPMYVCSLCNKNILATVDTYLS